MGGELKFLSRGGCCRAWWSEPAGRGTGQGLPRVTAPPRPSLRTTEVGFINRNAQTVLRATGLPGTDHGHTSMCCGAVIATRSMGEARTSISVAAHTAMADGQVSPLGSAVRIWTTALRRRCCGRNFWRAFYHPVPAMMAPFSEVC